MTASAPVDRLLTVREVVGRTTEFLREKGVVTARLDAELLIGEAVGMNRLQLYMSMDRPLDAAERDKARELVRRRAAREPVAYILGRREFLSREYIVNPAVLIPRPETELLVDHAEAELARRFPDQKQLRILELGIGSGAIAISLALDMPEAAIIATEISPEAAGVARRNAEKHNVHSRIDIRIQPDLAGIEPPFHCLVSNPPYIDPADAPSLEPEVTQFEPKQALFAENKGFAAIELILSSARSLLHPGGFCILEIGKGMAEQTKQIAAAHGLQSSAVYRDYAGIDRFPLFEPPA